MNWARRHAALLPNLDRGDAATYCACCARTWCVSSKERHCFRCHEHFADLQAIDLHLRNGSCIQEPLDVIDPAGIPLLVHCDDLKGFPYWRCRSGAPEGDGGESLREVKT